MTMPKTLDDFPLDEHICLSQLPAVLGRSRGSISRYCTVGLRSKRNGFMIQLRRWQTEAGWVTTREAIEEFRRNLDDPSYEEGQ